MGGQAQGGARGVSTTPMGSAGDLRTPAKPNVLGHFMKARGEEV